MTHVTIKQTLTSLSLSHQKKDGCAWPCPFFFWYDTDFLEFESFDFIDHILYKSVSYQKKAFFWYDNKDIKVCFLVTHVRWEVLTLTTISEVKMTVKT